jgi:hypothetical protein
MTTIGTSIVKAIDNPVGSTRPPSVAQSASFTGHRPVTLPASVIGRVVQRQDSKGDRVLLTGPARSGKSSLTMDLAYSIASPDSPCRLDCQGNCGCIAATIFVSRAKDVEFPLYCHHLDTHNGQNSPWYTALQATDTARESSWDPCVLQRIQVHHVDSVRDILTYLLQIQGAPASERPRMIVLDDLDVLIAPSPDAARILAQVLAILMDTCNVLEGLDRGRGPPTVVISMQVPEFQSKYAPVWSHFVSVHLEIEAVEEECPTLTQWQLMEGEDMVVISAWAIQRKPMQKGDDKVASSIAIKFAMVQTPQGNYIRWKEDSKEEKHIT